MSKPLPDIKNVTDVEPDVLLADLRELNQLADQLQRAHATGEIEYPEYYQCLSSLMPARVQLHIALVSLSVNDKIMKSQFQKVVVPVN